MQWIFAKIAARTGVAVLAAVAAANGAELSLPMASAAPGSSVVVPVTFTSQADSAAGIQFDLQYDSSVLSLIATPAETARTSGKTVYWRRLAPGQERFVIVGLNGNSFPDGAVIDLFVNLNPGAAAGQYPLTIANIVATGSSGQMAIVNPVSGRITVQGTARSGSRLQPEGVLNAASLLPGPVAPGEVVTLFGSGIGPISPQIPGGAATATVLGDIAVMFDGAPAPLLYAAANQVDAIVPYSIQSRSSTLLQIVRLRRPVAELSVAVVSASPSLFTIAGSGAGPGAILNRDYSVNSPSAPADKGSVIIFFATGAGQTNPAGIDGQIAGGALPKPLLPVSVEIGGIASQVVYAGAAPGLVSGILQVNCVVPMTAPSGYAVPVVLFIGSAGSPPGVTVAIK